MVSSNDNARFSLSPLFNLYNCQKTQNKNYSYFPTFGHTFLCPFFKSTTTFIYKKTKKTTLQHNAANPEFP